MKNAEYWIKTTKCGLRYSQALLTGLKTTPSLQTTALFSSAQVSVNQHLSRIGISYSESESNSQHVLPELLKQIGERVLEDGRLCINDRKGGVIIKKLGLHLIAIVWGILLGYFWFNLYLILLQHVLRAPTLVGPAGVIGFCVIPFAVAGWSIYRFVKFRSSTQYILTLGISYLIVVELIFTSTFFIEI